MAEMAPQPSALSKLHNGLEGRLSLLHPSLPQNPHLINNFFSPHPQFIRSLYFSLHELLLICTFSTLSVSVSSSFNFKQPNEIYADGRLTSTSADLIQSIVNYELTFSFTISLMFIIPFLQLSFCFFQSINLLLLFFLSPSNLRNPPSFLLPSFLLLPTKFLFMWPAPIPHPNFSIAMAKSVQTWFY